MIAVIGLVFSANANDISCVRPWHDSGRGRIILENSCHRSVEVSVSWTDAGGRAHSRNVTVPAWNQSTNRPGIATVSVGGRINNLRVDAPRRVVPRR